LPKCKVDSTSAPTLRKLLKKLKKKYRHIEEDLAEVLPDIAADYSTACNAARPPKRKLEWEHWKYDFGSSDLRRHPRDSFRVLGIFLEPEAEARERTMYLTLTWFKGDKSDVTTEEIREAVGKLMEALEQRDLVPDEEEDTSS
jgi:hypothetical protein